MPTLSCQVESITPLTDVVQHVVLVPDTNADFKAGQYLSVVMGDKDKRPFSIANAPRKDGKLELHIGAAPGNTYASEVLDKMRTAQKVTVECGLGNAYLRSEKRKPIILLAGGTGFSYTYSLLQALVAQDYHEPVFLYWGARTKADMYAFDELVALDKKIYQFTFVPVVDQPDDTWTGKTGWVHKAVLADFTGLEPYQVYLAGRFEMAGVAREDFHNKGLHLDNLYGDAYEFI